MEFQLKIDKGAALKALQTFPQGLGLNLRPAVKAGLRDIQIAAQSNHAFTSRSGNAERSITPEISASELSGKVFLDTGIAEYGPFLHRGTGVHGPSKKPFEIQAKDKKALRWTAGGKFRYAKRVKNPGIKGDPFLFRAAEQGKPGIIQRINAAVKRTLQQVGLA